MRNILIALMALVLSTGCLKAPSPYAPSDVQQKCQDDLKWDKVSGYTEGIVGGGGTAWAAAAPLWAKDFNQARTNVLVGASIGLVGGVGGAIWSHVNGQTYIDHGCGAVYGPPPFDQKRVSYKTEFYGPTKEQAGL